MRTMVLLAGPRSEIGSKNGENVSDRPYDTYNPLPVCDEYLGNVVGIDVPGKLPPLGDALARHFHTGRELNDELAQQLVSALDAARAAITQSQDADLSERWSDATLATSDDLDKWIETNRGKWVVQVWVG